MDKEIILHRLDRLANLDNLVGLSRFGINTANALGISMPKLKDLAKGVKKNTP